MLIRVKLFLNMAAECEKAFKYGADKQLLVCDLRKQEEREFVIYTGGALHEPSFL